MSATQGIGTDDLGPAPTVDEVAAALREDPVLVHATFGNGARDEVDAALTAKVAEAEEAGVPVYVALVPGVPDLAAGDYGTEAADDLAVRLADRVGDGFFFVAVDPHSLYAAELGTGEWQDTRVEYVPNQSEDEQTVLAGGIAYGIDQLADNGEDPAQYLTGIWRDPEWQYDRDGSLSDGFLTTFVPTTALVAVTIAVTLVVRTALTWRESAPATTLPTAGTRLRKEAPGTPVGNDATVEETLRSELAALQDLRAKRAHQRVDDAVRDRVDGSYDAARTLLESPGREGRREPDLVGALVLTRVARAALDAPTGAVYHPCFVNPLHGRATGSRAVDGGGTEVPVCRACARGGASDPYVVRRGLRSAPYYAGDDVWARTGYGALTDDLWSEVARSRRSRGGAA